MKETKPHKWSQAVYYVLASIVVLVLILLVAEMFFPSTSPELIPKMDYLSAKIMTRLRDTPARTLSNPAREKILLALNHEKTIGKSKTMTSMTYPPALPPFRIRSIPSMGRWRTWRNFTILPK
jgi:hypothetical protein